VHPLGSSEARHIELASGLSEAAGVVATVVAAAADAEGTSALAA